MLGIRTRIRAALKARLSGLPGAGSDPITSTSEIVAEEQIPIAVVWLDRDIEGDSSTSDSTHHELEISIVLIGKKDGGSAAIDVLEAMAEEVESRMATPFELIELAWESTSFEDQQEGKQPYPSATLRYRFEYTTPAGLSPEDPAGGG